MRTSVVTGSASGLGAAIAARLLADEHRVIGVDLRDAEVCADLSTADGRESMVDQVAGLVDGAVDAVVACAGVGPHISDLALIVSVNYFGATATLDGLLPLLASGDSPAAVAVSSNSLGITPMDEAVLAACLSDDEGAARTAASESEGAILYGTSKQALARAVRGRVQAWGDAGVRLTAVAPGPVNTPLLQGTKDDPLLGPAFAALPIPIGREGEPEEIADVVHFLLSPAASLLHGSIVFADGGTDALLRPDTV